jgi:hypothetical protein
MERGDAPPPLILAIDPGREKCGLALVDGRGAVIGRAVVPAPLASAHIAEWYAAHVPDHVLLGGGTGARDLRADLAARAIPLEIVSERETTLRARALYFADHPPRGLRRLLPRTLLTPPQPIDDYAACAIALAWLAGRPQG